MKILKKITVFFLAVVVLMSCSVSVFAAETEQQKTDVAIIIYDETGKYPGESIEVEFQNADSGKTVETVELTKNNSWGYSRGILISIPVQYTYKIVFKGVESGYSIVNTLNHSSVASEFTANKLGNDFYWSIVEEEDVKQSGNDVVENEITSTNKDNITVSNEEAERVYREFLEAVSFIATDETWSTGFFAFLNQYGEGSINKNTYSQWYADYVDGGSVEEFFAMSAFEQFVWTETYTRFANAMNDGWGYDHYFGDEFSFNQNIKKMATDLMNGNNSEVVKEAYTKLADWQYDYILTKGVPFNFINNRNYIEEMNPPKGEDNKTEDGTKDPSATTGKLENPGNTEELTKTDETPKDADTQDDENKGIWTDTLHILAKNALSVLVIAALAGAVCAVIYFHKRKNK